MIEPLFVTCQHCYSAEVPMQQRSCHYEGTCINCGTLNLALMDLPIFRKDDDVPPTRAERFQNAWTPGDELLSGFFC